KGRQYYKMLWEEDRKSKAFDRNRLAKALHKQTGDSISSQNLPITDLVWLNQNHLKFQYKDKEYQIEFANYQLQDLDDEAEGERDVSVSPNGRYAVYIKDNNLYLKDKTTGRVSALSTDGTTSYVYGSAYGWGQTMRG